MFTSSIGPAFHSNGKGDISWLRIFIFLIVRNNSGQSLLIADTVQPLHPHDGALAVLQTLPVRHRDSPDTVQRGGGTHPTTSLREKILLTLQCDGVVLVLPGPRTETSDWRGNSRRWRGRSPGVGDGIWEVKYFIAVSTLSISHFLETFFETDSSRHIRRLCRW